MQAVRAFDDRARKRKSSKLGRRPLKPRRSNSRYVRNPTRVERLGVGAFPSAHALPTAKPPLTPRQGVGVVPASFNARAEAVSSKPMFRDAFKRHRCVIPASGYYEWLKRPDRRQPYFISAADGGVLSFASPWDRWKNPETGERIASCTIIVTDANALTRPIHDRMPVVLETADIEPWLNGEAGAELLKPAGEDRLRMWPVSRRVNKTGTGDDDPTLLDGVTV
jgi:putative SOS response-associated peptidase YedK